MSEDPARDWVEQDLQQFKQELAEKVGVERAAQLTVFMDGLFEEIFGSEPKEPSMEQTAESILALAEAAPTWEELGLLQGMVLGRLAGMPSELT